MALTKEQIEHIATLARIELSDAEKNKFSGNLDSILNYIEQLNEADTSEVEPLYQVTGIYNRTRTDEATEGTGQKELVSAAPDHDGKYVKVRPILKK